MVLKVPSTSSNNLTVTLHDSASVIVVGNLVYQES